MRVEKRVREADFSYHQTLSNCFRMLMVGATGFEPVTSTV